MTPVEALTRAERLGPGARVAVVAPAGPSPRSGSRPGSTSCAAGASNRCSPRTSWTPTPRSDTSPERTGRGPAT
ncbi:hypothetical protein O1L60_32120 [Streptomyces diastatochromogenes]|nr:hypothetical protein [Streptomyces diastatochromogenes]